MSDNVPRKNELDRFAAHIAVSTTMFCLIATMAAGLHVFVVVITTFNLEKPVSRTIKLLELLLFGTDVLIFLVWNVVNTARALAAVWSSRE